MTTYDPTHESSPEGAGTVIVVIRDPDASNEYKAWTRRAGNVYAVDIDAGRDDLTDPAQYAEWSEGLGNLAKHLLHAGWLDASDYVLDTVRNYNPEGD